MGKWGVRKVRFSEGLVERKWLGEEIAGRKVERIWMGNLCTDQHQIAPIKKMSLCMARGVPGVIQEEIHNFSNISTDISRTTVPLMKIQRFIVDSPRIFPREMAESPFERCGTLRF
jgi:hypothetical protein